MKILVMENTTSYHEVAAETIRACGFEPICVDNIVEAMQLLNDVDAVITDLYFHVPPCGDKYAAEGPEPPAGLIVAFACARLDKPCIVLTAGDHHSYGSWWAYGAAEGYRCTDVDHKLFPIVKTGTKSASGSWRSTVYSLCRGFKATESQMLHFKELDEKFPFPSQQ